MKINKNEGVTQKNLKTSRNRNIKNQFKTNKKLHRPKCTS